MSENVLIKSIILASPIFLMFAGCGNANKPQVIRSPQEGTIIQVSETVVVDAGVVFDGAGILYDWVGEGDCSQTEGMPPMFRLSENATLKNLRMRNAPDGIHVRGSNVTIDNIVNLDVCEDAISIKLDRNKRAPRNTTISNSKFFDCADKAIQITRGDGLLIHNNEFHRCAKAIRVKEQATNIRFEDNKIYNAKTAVKVTGGEVFATGNLIDGAKVGFWAEQGGTVTDGGGNRLLGVSENIRETEGGRVIIE